jgi:hypothetical protein
VTPVLVRSWNGDSYEAPALTIHAPGVSITVPDNSTFPYLDKRTFPALCESLVKPNLLRLSESSQFMYLPSGETPFECGVAVEKCRLLGLVPANIQPPPANANENDVQFGFVEAHQTLKSAPGPNIKFAAVGSYRGSSAAEGCMVMYHTGGGWATSKVLTIYADAATYPVQGILCGNPNGSPIVRRSPYPLVESTKEPELPLVHSEL